MTNDDNQPSPKSSFDTTHWSVVLAAGRESSSNQKAALTELCQLYWYPLYAFARRKVGDAHKAQDLTQAFFAKLLEKNYVASADPERGKFRSFLLTALKGFMANEWDKERAIKRGGGHRIMSIDIEDGEKRYALEPVENVTAEKIYQRTWVMTLLDRVLKQLQDEFARDGKADLFDALKSRITPGNQSDSFEEISETLGMTVGATRVAAHRLRSRYRQLLREAIAQTVVDENEVDDEIRNLFAAFDP